MSMSVFGIDIFRCVVSLATRDHKLSICGKVGRHWVTLASLSDVWFEDNATSGWDRAGQQDDALLHQVYAARSLLLAVSRRF